MNRPLPACKSKYVFKSQWNAHIVKYRQSLLSESDYCVRHQLSPSRFRYWLNKSERGQSEFIPAVIQPSTISMATIYPATRHCTLELGNGKRLIIESDAALSEIARLLRRSF